MSTEKYTFSGIFFDAAAYDAANKTAVSVRDGTIVYLGSEIGMEPADKEFVVYRSPATISNAANLMRGIPLTDNHVDMGDPPESSVGSVTESKMIDFKNPETKSALAVQNKVTVNSDIVASLESGKRELSLGYNADLVPYEGDGGYDFEQRDIVPHHLAIVEQGRCGPACSFIDRKPSQEPQHNGVNEMSGKKTDKPGGVAEAFQDAEGNMSLERVIEIATNLPDAIKRMPMDKIQEIMPVLEEAVKAAGDAGAEPSDKPEEAREEEPAPAEDSAEDGEMKDKGDYKDSKAFADAVQSAVREYAEVVEKARKFVDENYKFAGKDTAQVMRDALAADGHDAKAFADSELAVAFKLLKPSSKSETLRNFGDGAPSKGRFDSIRDKEI
jgi:hypothetical protein